MKKTIKIVGIALILTFVGFGVNYVTAQITDQTAVELTEKDKEKDKRKKKEKKKGNEKAGGCCHGGGSGSCHK